MTFPTLFVNRRAYVRLKPMLIHVLHGLALLAAAFFAGIINAIAGGGTLITFPALILLGGLDAKSANATSTVALWPGLISGAWGYRKEMADSRDYIVRLGIPSFLGGAAGAVLLILTPSETFAKLVPFLILFATALFIAQQPISRRLHLKAAPTKPTATWWLFAMCFQFASATYGGYFGAGNGIIMLAALGLLGLTDIHRANGIKSIMGVCLNSIAIIIFIPIVNWPDAVLMAFAAVAGGYSGANVAKRLGRTFVRRTVVVIGLVIGVILLWREGTGH